MKMKKLWKVAVNNWGWNSPRTFYAESREAAAEIGEKFPASDGAEYAGNFTDENAAQLLNIYKNYKEYIWTHCYQLPYAD